MVVPGISSAVHLSMCLLADSPLSQLEPVARAKLLGGLILLAIGGVALVVLCWLTLRVGRRALRREDVIVQRLNRQTGADDWAAKPLVRPDKAVSDEILE